MVSPLQDHLRRLASAEADQVENECAKQLKALEGAQRSDAKAAREVLSATVEGARTRATAYSPTAGAEECPRCCVRGHGSFRLVPSASGSEPGLLCVYVGCGFTCTRPDAMAP